MTELSKTWEKDALEIVPIHFDVPEHFIPLDHFIETARSTKEIIECLNKEILEGQLQYQFIVLPPEPGTFKSKFGIKVIGTVLGGTIATAATFITVSLNVLESDVGKAYIKGRYGHEPAYIAERLGEDHREAEFQEKSEGKYKISHEDAVRILSEGTKNFLEKDYSELRKSGITKQKFRDAYRAKNEFYEASYSIPSIKGIGFDDTEDFPIKKNDFPNYITEIPLEEESKEEEDWTVEIRYIQVTSPNWDRSDVSRRWKCKYKKNDENKFAVFHVEDEAFWTLAERGQIDSNGVDSLKVQWAFVTENGKRKKTRVLKVLEYNGRPISKALNDQQLVEILYDFEIATKTQHDFFER